MDEMCGSRGWAMIMKIDGRKVTTLSFVDISSCPAHIILTQRPGAFWNSMLVLLLGFFKKNQLKFFLYESLKTRHKTKS